MALISPERECLFDGPADAVAMLYAVELFIVVAIINALLVGLAPLDLAFVYAAVT